MASAAVTGTEKQPEGLSVWAERVDVILPQEYETGLGSFIILLTYNSNTCSRQLQSALHILLLSLLIIIVVVVFFLTPQISLYSTLNAKLKDHIFQLGFKI